MALTYDELYEIQNKNKKKKKKEEEQQIITQPYSSRLILPKDEIAPVKTYTPTKTDAPTKSEKKEDERTWFKSSKYFDDGYDFGDVTKTILGTVADVGEHLVTALPSMVESGTDALAMLGSAMSRANINQANFNMMSSPLAVTKKGNEYASGLVATNNAVQKETEKVASDFVKKDLIDEEKVAKAIVTAPFQKLTGINVEDSSVLGERSDSTVQSAGQLAASIGLQALGVPITLTTGLTAFGSQSEKALNEGATYDQAALSATISAGAEVLSEYLSGGIKVKLPGQAASKTLDDALIKPFTEKISNGVLKKLVNIGVDATGEGFEEIFSSVVSNLGEKLYKEESIGELIGNDEARDEYLESFIAGMLLGGASSSVKTISDTNRAKNALNENEQKVFDKVVEERITEATENNNGKTISKNEETKIRKAVLNDMLKGYIDTDTIESVLGGETYKTYKDTVDNETALKEEFNTLNKMKQGEMTGEQLDRRAELKQQLEELKNNSKTSEIKSKLGEDVFNLVKDSRLSESYNERSRRGQAFEADLSKYDAKQQETVKKAIESGILNNTNRTHEFVDMVAKISADKGVLFDFVNNEKLKASGFAVEGKTVNGYKTDEGNIAVNIQSSKSLDSVVGHEITHVLEGTELYTELQNAVKEYATTKGEYVDRMQALRKMYEGVYKGKDFDDKIRAELTADIVGEYLFTDADFINRLSTEKPNVFKKLYDEIKYLCKIATAGSKEARQLEKVKRNFEKAYKEATKNTDKGTQNSLSDNNITVESTGYASGESYYTMSYKQDGKVIGTVEYGEYEGQPNVKMIEVEPEYRRKGIGTKLLQELQKKYPDKEINFGMSTPDGTKLLESITYDVTDEAVVSGREELKSLQTELNELQEKLDVLYDVETPTEAQIAEVEKLGDRWNEVYDSIHRLEQTLRGKRATKTFVKADTKYSLSENLEKNGKLLYNNSPLSVDNRAKTNNNSSIKWVYDAEIFSVKESKQFHSKISEINQGSEAFSKNSAGEYMIPIENKIVFTDGNYDSPYVREIVEVLTEYQTEFDDIRECIFNVEKGKSSKQDEARYVYLTYGKGRIISYQSGISGVYGWENGQRKGKSRRAVVGNYLNKQNRTRNDRTSQEAPINEIAPIEASSEDGVFFDAEKTKYSLSEDSKGRKLTKDQQDYFKKVSPLLKDENGNIKRYYHGTARGDRVGTYFNPERATSGPMAFFTDNPEIAENYSKSKADTSMSYDSDYDSYETQFRVNINGNDMPLIDAWRYLPMSARARIKERAEHTHYDWDDYETLIYDEDTTEAGGGFSWQIREARGNILRALNEQWLNSGNLFNEEGKYIDVLKFIGVHDEFKKLGYGEPYYKDPYYREEKVFEVYLNVTNPFHTADVDEEFLNDARDWVDNTDLSIYESETADSDLWDKRSLDPYEWLDRLESDIENETTHAWTSIPDVITDFLKEYGGYDGIVDAGGKHTGYGHQVVIPFYSEQIKNIDNETPTTDVHIDLSLSGKGETFNDNGRFYGKDIMYQPADIAPTETEQVAPSVAEKSPVVGTVNEEDYAPMTEAEAEAMYSDEGYINSFTDADMPPEMDAPIYSPDTTSVNEKSLKNISAMGRDILFLTPKERRSLEDVVQKYSTSETQNEAELFNEIKKLFGEKSWSERIEEVAEIQQILKGYKINVSPYIKRDIADYTRFMRSNFGKISFSKEGIDVDTAYMELSAAYPSFFPSDIVNPTDQLLQMADVANMTKDETRTAELDDDVIQEATDVITEAVSSYKEKQLLKLAEKDSRAALRDELKKDKEAQKEAEKAQKQAEREAKPTRAKLHNSIIENIKNNFAEKGFDFDEVLKKAKNLATIRTVDNTPQRVMEKALGYKQGQALADETVNKVAQNESEGIKWLNSFTDRKNGVLAQISKQYNIKPGSKKSAAAQMYAEGFYVDKNNEIIEYGDRELAIDFPDAKVQADIKGLAKDPRIRQIYDDTLAAINESRSRNLYPEIPRLDNYFLHFRAMEDTFSQLGLPFNPNDIRAKDLPTELNGVTADLKPGQPYFASAKHREGMRTSFDLLGGLERYLSSAKNQIYHIDDIQTLRALRNYIADTYGQAKGLESLDDLTDEEAQYRIEQVYSSHLSTFARFLNEEANVLAGKTTLIDRGLEGVFGRKALTFFDTLNKQVGSNMVGWNISSSLTNFLPVAQTFAKTNKFDFTKAFAQTVSSKIGSIFGKTDSFVENNPTIIRRKGAERFYRTPFQKIGDTGYVLMSAVDDISTELIVRTKYNELIRKGMDEQKASFEADKWASRLMGDRSLGQQPQLYNSKGLGLLTKFQLEVRNQLDSQFYDTIQEAKVSNEEIENKLLKNAKTAAKVTSVFFQLAAVQYLYGKAFESIAGYNPAFDIIEVLIKTLGFDDDEEDDDTVLDNIEEGFLALLGDLPYTSTLTGGRIPISSALPVKELIKGEDQYGNEKSRWETVKETAPYYLLPTGYGQIKKTAQGLGMFSDEHPVAGSYTDSGNLRFPVEETPLNVLQAGVFGQYASENARYYFDNEISPLKEKQIQEYIDVEMPIKDYWQYREDLKDLETLEDKFDFVAGMDLPVEKKNILINNIVDRKEKVDLENYDDFENYEEFDFYAKNTEKYNFLQDNGVSYKEYKADEDTKEKYDSVYSWWKNNPEKVTLSKAVTDNVIEYRGYASDLNDIRADKDEDGKSISGSAKEKKQAYIWNLDIDEGAKYVLFKNEYNADDTYNYEILDYLFNRDDLTYDEVNTICEELGFKVNRETGYIYW